MTKYVVNVCAGSRSSSRDPAESGRRRSDSSNDGEILEEVQHALYKAKWRSVSTLWSLDSCHWQHALYKKHNHPHTLIHTYTRACTHTCTCVHSSFSLFNRLAEEDMNRVINRMKVRSFRFHKCDDVLQMTNIRAYVHYACTASCMHTSRCVATIRATASSRRAPSAPRCFSSTSAPSAPRSGGRSHTFSRPVNACISRARLQCRAHDARDVVYVPRLARSAR